MPRATDELTLRPEHPEGNYRVARVMAQLRRPFSAGRVYLDRLVAGAGRERYLERIRSDYTLYAWRRDPSFLRWLERVERVRA